MDGNLAIRSYYKISEVLETALLSNNITKTVTIGDVSDVDLGKQTIFPLAHFIVNSVTSAEQTLTYNITVLAMDIKDTSKSEETDKFRKNTDGPNTCLLYTSPSPRDRTRSRMPSSA